jgi:hypothetical protein
MLSALFYQFRNQINQRFTKQIEWGRDGVKGIVGIILEVMPKYKGGEIGDGKGGKTN